MLKNIFFYAGVLIFWNSFLTFDSWAGNLSVMCPGYADKPGYERTLTHYSYRLRNVVTRLGCGVIPVYKAFRSDTSALLAAAEEDDVLMQELVGFLEGREDIVDSLSKSPKLTDALGVHLLESPENRAEYLQQLRGLDSEAFEGRTDTHILVLAALLPGASIRQIRNSFSPQEMAVLRDLAMNCLIISEVEGEEEAVHLNPWFITNPNASLKVLKSVITAWGTPTLSNLLPRMASTPDFISSLVPPLNPDDVALTTKTTFNAAQFKTMQQDYIHIMRDLYLKTSERYSPAWGAEICAAFSELLPPALIGASPAQVRSLSTFLLALPDSLLFSNIFKPGGCFEPPNSSLFTSLVRDGALFAPVAGHNSPLRALAEWYDEGTAAFLIQKWLKHTDANKFNASVKNFMSEAPRPDKEGDAAFILNLTGLAMFRETLADSQEKQILDTLCTKLSEPGVPLADVLAFLNEVAPSLFEVLKNGNYRNPEQVALKMINYGYPESNNPSLFKYFRGINPDSLPPPDPKNVILKLGRLEEQQLMEYGQTFADRHHGYSKEDVVEGGLIVVDVAQVCAAAAATVMSAGAATPTLGAAVANVAARQAAKQAAKQGMKQAMKQGLKRGSRALEKNAINLARAKVTAPSIGISRALMRSKKPPQSTPRLPPKERPGENARRALPEVLWLLMYLDIDDNGSPVDLIESQLEPSICPQEKKAGGSLE